MGKNNQNPKDYQEYEQRTYYSYFSNIFLSIIQSITPHIPGLVIYIINLSKFKYCKMKKMSIVISRVPKRQMLFAVVEYQ